MGDGNETPVMVSVIMITYGHEQYIEEAMNGVLIQESSFPVELIIANDCSPDGTDEVVKKVMERAPSNITIRYTCHQENKGANPNFIWAAKQAEGKYIALCEGDDFWTDPLKLQKQVDFLESNLGFSMIFSNAHIIIGEGADKKKKYRDLRLIDRSRVFSDIEIFEEWTIPTASVLFRGSAISDQLYRLLGNQVFMFGDIVLFLYLSTKGQIYGQNEFTTSYRKHSGGATQIKDTTQRSQVFNVHVLEVINIFGTHLKTKKIKTILSRNYMYTSLSHFKMKHFKGGFIAMRKSIFHDYKIYLKYILSKIGFIPKRHT